ncbi:hypothetical protein NC653_014354 [Populus alba x Populus x berolinensis]|uniref:Uncharacterized protein n=1 Tax=Populus alba x Populus x berolinensis TaxID=444605 RepID=A0AAD6W3P5_9ROSI|nr:hypothetical protein NC653_014354 [Populus alba x Populus x berolinensis]
MEQRHQTVNQLLSGMAGGRGWCWSGFLDPRVDRCFYCCYEALTCLEGECQASYVLLLGSSETPTVGHGHLILPVGKCSIGKAGGGHLHIC